MPTQKRTSVLSFPVVCDKYYYPGDRGNVAENSSPSADTLPNTTGKPPVVSERARDKTDEFLAAFAKAADFSGILKSISDTLASVGGGQ